MGIRERFSDRVGASLSDHFREVYERDRQWILQFDLKQLNDFIWPLFIAYLCLNFLDVYMTTLAMNFGPIFTEQNPLAAALFSRQFQGYLFALAFKYLPVLPIFYVVFATDPKNEHPFGLRLVKFSILVALVGMNAVLFYIVGVHNLESFLGLVPAFR